MQAASQFADHGKSCCSMARFWLVALDRSRSFRDGGWHPPTWLRARYSWGAMRWPVHWCDVPAATDLDCGSLAALATALFRSRGEVAGSVQLILRYPRWATAGWAAMWLRSDLLPTWIHDNLCYHEATVVVRNRQVTIWDPTESRWIESEGAHHQQYAGVVSLRLGADQFPAGSVAWGDRSLPVGQWVTLSEAATPG
jgi:hypothetical protein